MKNKGEYFNLYKDIPIILKHNNYSTRWDMPGKLLITKIDTVNKFVAGEFEFTATNPDNGKTIKITEGRFDVQFDYCQ